MAECREGFIKVGMQSREPLLHLPWWHMHPGAMGVSSIVAEEMEQYFSKAHGDMAHEHQGIQVRTYHGNCFEVMVEIR